MKFLKLTAEEAKQYRSLQKVFDDALVRAMRGKGKKRHAEPGKPFEKQQICEIARRLEGSPVAGLLQQVVKKIYETSRLPYAQARKELLDACDYTAAAVIRLDEINRKAKKKCSPANTSKS